MKAKTRIKPLPYEVKRYLKEVEKYTETEAKRLSALLVNHKEEAEISEDIKEQLRTFKSYCKINKEIKFKDGLTLKTLKSLELNNIEFILDNIINRKIIETQALNDLLINMIKEKVPACIIELIISAGAKTDTTDENGKTALDIAIEHGKTYCVELLQMYKKTNPDNRDMDVPAQIAPVSAIPITPTGTREELEKIVEGLKKKLSDLAIANNERNVDDECKDLMLSFKDSKDQAYEGGKTILMLAAELGYPKVVNFLINAGAKTDTTDENGKTALDIAKQYGKNGCIKFLSEVAGQGIGSKKPIDLDKLLAAIPEELIPAPFIKNTGKNLGLKAKKGYESKLQPQEPIDLTKLLNAIPEDLRPGPFIKNTGKKSGLKAVKPQSPQNQKNSYLELEKLEGFLKTPKTPVETPVETSVKKPVKISKKRGRIQRRHRIHKTSKKNCKNSS